MTDLMLTFANCGNQFVFAEGEQEYYRRKGLAQPKYCPICRGIFKAAGSRPAKPQDSPQKKRPA